MTAIKQAWTPDVTLTREIEDQYSKAIGSYREDHHLITEHANHEEQIRVGGYANRTLLELVQNAADQIVGVRAEAADPFDGRVEIILDLAQRTLYCANWGRPFSKKGLVAISHAFLSGKDGDEIGRFGLGFKSVLAVTESPEVFSRTVSFGFNSPAARAELNRIDPSARRLPVLRTPTLLNTQSAFDEDPMLAELAEWASTIVKLPNIGRGTGEDNLIRLQREMRGFDSEFLLFVSAVREVRLRVIGEDGFNTSHVSRSLGDGRYKLESSESDRGEEWIIAERMHEPTEDARKEVGEAVARRQIKVTVAVPVRLAAQRKGRFWAYFPLLDETSASALFNAPWSVNDDRTTLLENTYNREILATLSEMFVGIVDRVRTSDDPAAHLDYLPARGREELSSFGARTLATEIPRLAATLPLIPDALGELRMPAELRPLDFTAVVMPKEEFHQAWALSPNTKDDVPHWKCYRTDQRISRIRTLCAIGATPELMEEDGRDMKRALEIMPRRGLLTWLREWAEGTDPISAANALKFVYANRGKEDLELAKVILTSDGVRSLHDRSTVFLRREEGIDIEGAVFVQPDFLAQPGVEEILGKCGFRNLNPVAILNARVAQLGVEPGETELVRFWDAVLDVSPQDVQNVLKRHPLSGVKVPTRDGAWSRPELVVDIAEVLPDSYDSITLDRTRCLPSVAHQLGVINEPVKDYDLADELFQDSYKSWVRERLNSRLDPGERPIERVAPYPRSDISPGPFSMLFVLRDAGASLPLREEWTRKLLLFGDSVWECEDSGSQGSRRIPSPVRWAVDQAGIVKSTGGYREPRNVVAPSLVQYQGLLPLYIGPSPIAQTLKLPDRLERVPAHVFVDALKAETLPTTIPDVVLAEFILTASRIAYTDSRPPRIPARVGRAIESRSPRSVFLAIDDEQQDFLRQHQRPFLRVTAEVADDLATTAGCQRFEDNFAFSIIVEGEQEREPVLDLFTGLRATLAADLVSNATITRTARITKRVTTADGVEDQALPWHVEGLDLKVDSELEPFALLRVVNEAFELHLNNGELQAVLRAGLDHLLEQQRLEALAAGSDAERLDVYFGRDDLRDALPKGLWRALAAQGLVNDDTSVAQLYLTVYGSDSISQLQALFREAGFGDVPTTWAGGAATISWLRRMGFGAEYAGQRTRHQDAEFVVPGATILHGLHDFQVDISASLRRVLTQREPDGRALKAMVELPTGAGKTRVATETVLRLFITGELSGPVIWIAQSQELCEQAVQTWSTVWRWLGDERPLTIGRLWEGNTVHEPDTEFSVIVATDAKLDVILKDLEYDWLWASAAVIIDEGHVAGDSQRYTRLLSKLGVDGRNWARPLVGLSATPFKGRSEDATKRLASRFGNRILRAFETDPYSQLASQGVLARIKHTTLRGISVELSASERADAEQKRLVSPNVLERIGRNQARMATLVKHIQTLVGEHADWPVLVFTPSVLSAQILAATLRYQDISAASVSGQTGRQERRDVIARFKDNDIQVLANCDLLAQGFDAPGVQALYIARPTFSPNAYIQMAGRGLRGPENGGKEECLIVDFADNFGDFNEFLGYREYEELWKEQA